MIRLQFKNIEKSDFVRDLVLERLEALLVKLPDLSKGRLNLTLEMENSPRQAGKDQFKVKIHVLSGRYRGLTVTKRESHLYIALADVIDHLLECLNRYGDRVRMKQRRQARKLSHDTSLNIDQDELKTG